MQMLNTTFLNGIGLVALAIGLPGAAALAQTEIEIRTQPQPVEIRKVYVERPPGTVVIVGTAPTDGVQMFRDRDFQDSGTLLNVMAGNAAGQTHDLPNGLEDSLTSLRWSLPPGVLVMLYEDDGAKGEQFALWGNGQIDNLAAFDFNDKASQWAWYYVGGAHEPTEVIVRGAAIPVGSVAWTGAAENSMQLFKSKNFEANTVTVSPVTAQAAGTLHRLPEDLPDSLTSMRWNLPPGVVVMMHQDADGTKQQIAMWGSGQVSDLDVWDFNDKASRWAWYYVGSPEAPTLGYTPPPEINSPKIIVVDKDAIDLVGRSMVPTELDVKVNDLRAKKNPTGEGTFVYVPTTQFDGIERHIVWMVMDGKAYALTGPAKMITPRALLPADASETTWASTGLSVQNAEDDAIKIVFTDD